jgi:hypothetical protein
VREGACMGGPSSFLLNQALLPGGKECLDSRSNESALEDKREDAWGGSPDNQSVQESCCLAYCQPCSSLYSV